MDNKIRESSDYNKFELLPFNRDVKKIDRLVASMKEHGFIAAYPIHCIRNKGNGNLKIKAGHHRYKAAKELGLPIKYVVCNDRATIYELERATARWLMEDYLVSYISEGRAPYIAVKRYQERTGIPLALSISMLGGQSAGSGNKISAFKRGSYDLGDPTHAEGVADIVLHITEQCKIAWGTHSLLVRAISRILWVEEFDPQRLKKKIKTYSSLMEKQPNLQAYMELLETIYNRQSQNKMPLTFFADQAAIQRNVIQQHGEKV